MANDIAVMFTAYNDGQTLDQLIPQVREVTDNKVDICVVNDGSTDDTSIIVAKHGCRSVDLPKNQGVGAAYKAGFLALLEADKYDYVIKIDADGQHDSSYIPKVIHYLKVGFEPVVCSRFHPSTVHDGTPLDRVILNDCFAGHLARRTSWQITDARSGFFGLSTAMLRIITPQLITQRYGIPMEVMIRIWANNPRSRHLEIAHPSIYQNHGNVRRREQYQTEDVDAKLQRFIEAYRALIAVYEDMGVSADDLIESLNVGFPKRFIKK